MRGTGHILPSTWALPPYPRKYLGTCILPFISSLVSLGVKYYFWINTCIEFEIKTSLHLTKTCWNTVWVEHSFLEISRVSLQTATFLIYSSCTYHKDHNQKEQPNASTQLAFYYQSTLCDWIPLCFISSSVEIRTRLTSLCVLPTVSKYVSMYFVFMYTFSRVKALLTFCLHRLLRV